MQNSLITIEAPRALRILWVAPLLASVTLAVGLRAADVALYGVVKGQTYYQATEAAPSLEDEYPPFQFLALTELAVPGSLLNVTLRRPDGTVVFDGVPPGPFGSDYAEDFDQLYQLNEAFPNGDYPFEFTTQNDGTPSATLLLTSDDYPNVPFVTNFDAAQNIDVASPFTLQWEPFAGGTDTDIIEVYVDDAQGTPYFETPEWGEPGALTGRDTSVTIPANTLAPGREFWATILFVRLVEEDITSYPGAYGITGYYRRTACRLRSAGLDTGTAPSLESVSPSWFRTDVSPESVVAFQFSKPMQPTVAIEWSANVDPADILYTWAGDARALYCVHSTGWPSTEPVTWALNPPGAAAFMRDAAGLLLPLESGQFSAFGPNMEGPDVRECVLFKAIEYIQTGTTPRPQGYYYGGVFAGLNALNRVTDGEVILPGGGRAPLYHDESGDEVYAETALASASDLDRFVPDGTYEITLETVADGTVTWSLALTGGAYPNAPQILDFASTASVDASADYTLRWASFQGGTVDDLIFLEVESDLGSLVIETGGDDPRALPALDGTSTQVVIPAGRLSPGRTYRAWLTFARLVDYDDTTYPGVEALAGYVTDTEFVLRTAGTPVPPRIESLTHSSDNIQFEVVGDPLRGYRVEATTDLRNAAGWFPVWNQYTDDQGRYLFSSPFVPGEPYRFYRVREMEAREL